MENFPAYSPRATQESGKHRYFEYHALRTAQLMRKKIVHAHAREGLLMNFH